MYARIMELIDLLEQSGDMSVARREEQGEVSLTLENFAGFSDDWDELPREYAQPELVDEFEELVEQVAYGDYYLYFDFSGIVYQLGYASMDI